MSEVIEPDVHKSMQTCIACYDNAKNRSPKRHNPSMYERVKSKVSRSLSNSLVVQKSQETESSKVNKRPTSLVSGGQVLKTNLPSNQIKPNGDNIWNSGKSQNNTKQNENGVWHCTFCTLENSNNNDTCEACERPHNKKGSTQSSTLPRNGIVITIPEWGHSEVKTRSLLRGDKSSRERGAGISPAAGVSPTEQSLARPSYRRSLSEVNYARDQEAAAKQAASNRRSLVETTSPNNVYENINSLQVSSTDASIFKHNTYKIWLFSTFLKQLIVINTDKMHNVFLKLFFIWLITKHLIASNSERWHQIVANKTTSSKGYNLLCVFIKLRNVQWLSEVE
jgi:hypothetical protein